MSDTPKKEKVKYKPWPKVQRKAEQRGVTPVDLKKIKRLYLQCPHFDWKPFCDYYGFDYKSSRDRWKEMYGEDFQQWKREWVKRQTQTQDDEIVEELLAVRKAISHSRIKFVKDWTKRTEYMKTLLDAIMRTHGEALTHDMQNTLAIQAGKTQRRFKLGSDELGGLASAAIRLQELEQRALMIVGVELKQDAEKETEEDDAIPDVAVTTIGQTGMSSAEAVKMLAGYFDQYEQKSLPPPEKKDVEADSV